MRHPPTPFSECVPRSSNWIPEPATRSLTILASSEGAAMSLLFAATHPERTAALVLRSAYPRTMWAPDYPNPCPRARESGAVVFRNANQSAIVGQRIALGR